ncbi:MAG: cell envelope integrity protein TolA [Bacteroidota bacterium]|nr:cell envelope integrity protein TolA [Bacteroidota bacterium]
MNPFKNIRGLIGTILFHGFLLAILIFFSFHAPFPPPPEQGIEINFGTNEVGSGLVEPKRQQYTPPVQEEVQQEEAQPVIPEAVVEIPGEAEKEAQDLLTQELEEAAKIAAQKAKDEDAERKRLKEIEDKRLEEIEKQRLADLERERIEKERLRQLEVERIRKAEVEKKRQEEQQRQRNEINQRMQRSFGGQGDSGENESEGVREGLGNQGVKTGNVNSQDRNMINSSGTGVSYSLEGRSVIGPLKRPTYPGQETGKVVVQITVNKNGRVVSAVPGVRGSTTMDSKLLAAAKKAAMTAIFNKLNNPDAAISQKGTITYVFKITGG